MRTMTNPAEVFEIHKDNRQFREALAMDSGVVNIAVRQFINSLGFRAPRELAQQFIDMAKAQPAV